MNRCVFIVVAILFFSSLAMAGGRKQDRAYIGLTLAGQSMLDTDLSSNDGLTDAVLKAVDAKMKFKDFGYGLGGAVGYKWANGFRLESELNYFKSDIDKVKSNAGSIGVDGSVDMKSVMVNALWEFENETDWYSFLGMGAGYGWSKGTLEGGGDKVSSTCSIPLVQPILGVGYKITDNVSMAIDYKFVMGLQKLDYKDLKGDYKAHRLGLGVRYNF
jgi:OmpA-like transmembrane domain.